MILVLRLGVWDGLGVGSWGGIRAQLSQASAVCSRCVRKRPRPKIVAKRIFVVTFGLALGPRVTSLSTIKGVAKRRLVITFELAFGPGVSRASTVTGVDGVARCKTIVTFGLAIGPRLSKMTTVTGIGRVAIAK